MEYRFHDDTSAAPGMAGAEQVLDPAAAIAVETGIAPHDDGAPAEAVSDAT